MEAQHPGSRIPGSVAIAHDARPQPSGGAELGDLLEEIDVRIEEEGKPWSELVDVQSGRHRGLDVGHPVGECEGQLLDCGRARLPDVVAGDGDCVPAGHVPGGEDDRVHHQAHRWFRGEDVLLLGDVLLEDVVLEGSPQAVGADSGLLAGRDVHGVDDGGG